MALNTVSTNRLSTNVKPSNLSSGFGPLGSRNMLINGAMQINARGNGSLTINSSTGQFPCDRWVARGEGGSKAYTIQQVSVASSGLGVRNAIKVTSSQAASVAASDIFNVRQMVEGFNIQRMNFGESGCKSMTLSFTVRSSVAGTHSGAIQNSAQNRSYPFTYTLSADTWTDISVTIPPITDGSSWNETDGVGVRVVFDMGCGNNFRGTAGQWNSAQDEGATGSVRILENNGATWEVTKVQLEVGTEGTDFERRSIGDEEKLCKRYYISTTDFHHICVNNGESDRWIRFMVEMRTAPTVTTSPTNSVSFAAQNQTQHGFAGNGSGASLANFNMPWTADAEL